MVTDSSNHCENIVSAIRHINKEKLYFDSIKEIIYCYNIVCCSQKNKNTGIIPYYFYIRYYLTDSYLKFHLLLFSKYII
jgi:hypothetical protein